MDRRETCKVVARMVGIARWRFVAVDHSGNDIAASESLFSRLFATVPGWRERRALDRLVGELGAMGWSMVTGSTGGLALASGDWWSLTPSRGAGQGPAR